MSYAREMRRNASLEEAVWRVNGNFICSAIVGFGLGVAAKLVSGNYEPRAAAIASAVLSVPFLSAREEAVSKYLCVNTGLNVGYNAAYAVTDAFMKLFMH